MGPLEEAEFAPMSEQPPPPSKPSPPSLTPANPSASDWAAARGEKWRAQAAGMEAMLAPVDDPLIRALNLTTPCMIADIGCHLLTGMTLVRQVFKQLNTESGRTVVCPLGGM